MGKSREQWDEYWLYEINRQQSADEDLQSRLCLAMAGVESGGDLQTRIVELAQWRPQTLFCTAHSTRGIDVWYDCVFCLDESHDWARRHNFTQCVSPYIQREGTDKGEWVRAHAGRWVNKAARRESVS